MKRITRRNFLELTGMAALLAAAGVLTGCGGESQGAIISEDGAINVPIPDVDAAEKEKYTTVGDFAVYPMVCEAAEDDSEGGYGPLLVLYLAIQNNSGADYVLDKTKMTAWLDKKPGKIVALDGSCEDVDTGLQSSVVLPKGEETMVCIYVQDSNDASTATFVLQLGDQKAKITI